MRWSRLLPRPHGHRPREGAGHAPARSHAPAPAPAPAGDRQAASEIDRRELLSLAFLRRQPAGEGSRRPPPAAPDPAVPRSLIRPPGAVDEAAFVERCDACGACLSACPYGALVVLADGRPGVDPAGDPCLLCLDVPCSRACPSGALKPVVDPRRVRIALAEIEADRCLAWDAPRPTRAAGGPEATPGEACRACFDACPLPHQALRLFGAPGRPDISPSLCTGCGVCVRACPAGAISLNPR